MSEQQKETLKEEFDQKWIKKIEEDRTRGVDLLDDLYELIEETIEGMQHMMDAEALRAERLLRDRNTLIKALVSERRTRARARSMA